MDDPVAKLMHMGKETCKKLADLAAAAEQANMELDLEQHLACVEKVRGGGEVLYSTSRGVGLAAVLGIGCTCTRKPSCSSEKGVKRRWCLQCLNSELGNGGEG